MISCPICQISNDDGARFCAECGAKLSAGPGGAPPSKPASAKPRLNSPMLAGNEMPPTVAEDGEMDRLRRMQNKGNPPPSSDPAGHAPAGNPPRKLRSPLLAAEEYDEEDSPAPPPRSQGAGRRPLHSPLLGTDSDHLQGHPAANDQGQTGGRAHLHSPLLGLGEDDEYSDEQAYVEASGRPFRSPLLGSGGGPSDGGRSGGLRSPMLSGAASQGGGQFVDDYYEDEDPYKDEDNPNVLRSPLLAAKRPLDSEPRRPKPQPPEQPPAPTFRHPSQASPAPAAPAQPQYQGASPQFQSTPPSPPTAPQYPAQQAYSYQTEPVAPPASAPIQPEPMVVTPPSAPPPAPPAAYAQPNAAPAPAPLLPPTPPTSPPVQAPEEKIEPIEPFPDMTRYRREGAEPEGQVVDLTALVAPKQAPANASPFVEPLPAAAPPEEKPKPSVPSPKPKRSAPKMLDNITEEDFPEPSRPDFGQPPMSAPSSPAVKLLAGVAMVLALVKLGAFLQYGDWLKFAPFIIDQLVTVVALIALSIALLMSKN